MRDADAANADGVAVFKCVYVKTMACAIFHSVGFLVGLSSEQGFGHAEILRLRDLHVIWRTSCKPHD